MVIIKHMKNTHYMIGRTVFIGGDWTRQGRYLKHNQMCGLLFRYVKVGGNLVRITSLVN